MTLTARDSDCEVRFIEPPHWVHRLFGGGKTEPADSGERGFLLRVISRDDFKLISVRAADAVALEPIQFQRCTVQCYQLIARELANGRAKHPVRFWNFIPRIGEPMGAALDRYMIFNAGRFAGFCAGNWPHDGFAARMATASGVGHERDDLTIHCLASRRPGFAIENPRQIPAYQYSRQYGPFSPSFTRATLLSPVGAQPAKVLVGGTASIRGEHSAHRASLERQIDETLLNLDAVVREAARHANAGANGSVGRKFKVALAHYHALRIYYVDEADRACIESRIQAAFPQVDDLEWMRTTLCRPELRIEIEGVADLIECTRRERGSSPCVVHGAGRQHNGASVDDDHQLPATTTQCTIRNPAPNRP